MNAFPLVHPPSFREDSVLDLDDAWLSEHAGQVRPPNVHEHVGRVDAGAGDGSSSADVPRCEIIDRENVFSAKIVIDSGILGAAGHLFVVEPEPLVRVSKWANKGIVVAGMDVSRMDKNCVQNILSRIWEKFVNLEFRGKLKPVVKFDIVELFKVKTEPFQLKG